MADNQITPVDEEQAKFVDEQTAALLAYTIDCLDANRAEGNNVLQWLFGVVVGGLGAVGGLWVAGYPCLAVAFMGAVVGAMRASARLVRELRGRDTAPPGNLATNLNTMLDETAARMRWRAAKGMDAKIEQNRREVLQLGSAVDRARERFVTLPGWFAVALLLALAVQEVRRLN